MCFSWYGTLWQWLTLWYPLQCCEWNNFWHGTSYFHATNSLVWCWHFLNKHFAPLSPSCYTVMTACLRANWWYWWYPCLQLWPSLFSWAQSISSDICSASVFLDSEILSASHENFETFFLSKRSSAAQKLLRKVFVKYQKNEFSGMDISFLGLAGRIKELL